MKYVYQVAIRNSVKGTEETTLHTTPKKAIKWLKLILKLNKDLTLKDVGKTKDSIKREIIKDKSSLFFTYNTHNILICYCISKKRLF